MNSSSLSQRLIYVIGCPGAGKGTLCAKLASTWGWAHVSVGDELREYVEERGLEDDIVAACVRSMTLVPVEQLVQIISGRIQRLKEQGYVSFIIDGFPRHVEQITHMQAVIGNPDIVLFMTCPKDLAKERVQKRNLIGRNDSGEVFEKRFAEFCANNPCILDKFKAEGKLRKVNTSYTEEVSYENVLVALKDDITSLQVAVV